MATATAPAQKFYTYKAAANQAIAKNGGTLAFQAGKGYFVKPAPAPAKGTVPVAPNPLAPLTGAQLAAQAQTMADAQINPQRDAILAAQAAADKASAANTEALKGFSLAGAKLLGDQGAQYGDVFTKGATELGQLAGGFSSADAARLAAAEAANRDFVKSQVGGVGPSTAPSPGASQDAEYALAGSIPGEQLTREGAAATTWGLAQPKIDLAQATQNILAEIASNSKTDAQFVQQIKDLEATRPDVYNKIIQDLTNTEISKTDERIKAQAQALYAKQFATKTKQTATKLAIDQAYKKATILLRENSLILAQQKQQAALQKEVDRGRQIDAAGSKVVGHIVDKQGRPILDGNGNLMPVKAAPSSAGKKGPGGISATTRARVTASASTNAYKAAVAAKGKPLANHSGIGGAYIAAPGAKGADVIPGHGTAIPASTNNPNKAARSSSVTPQQAFDQVWGAIGGDTLVAQYGIPRAKLVAIVKAQLRRAGWKIA